MRILVQSDPFDVGQETAEFAKGHENVGALVTFTGIVRNNEAGTLCEMQIEHYPGMTEKALTEIASEAQTRWDLQDVLVIHRHGTLVPGDMIMMVATAARHRRAAFESADFLMDFLKSRAPFWKREVTADSAEWVASKADDEDALNRW